MVFGPIIDHLLSRKGIIRVEVESRELLLAAFHEALKDAFAARERNAAGDYRPDPKAERFPEYDRAPPASAVSAPPPSRKQQPKASLKGLFADWRAEAKAAGRTESTFDSYWRTFRLLGESLGHDDASRISRDDIVRFKDHRLAQGIRLKTVRDSDIVALKSVFGWAVGNGRMAANPAANIKLMVAQPVRTRERDFTRAEAIAILRHASGYVPGKNESAKGAAAKRWVPWICAYTGARVGEIVQLRRQDVEEVEGAWTINITPEAGTVKDKKPRRVALHPHLIELGFVTDFVAKGSQHHPGVSPYLFLTLPRTTGGDTRSRRLLARSVSIATS